MPATAIRPALLLLAGVSLPLLLAFLAIERYWTPLVLIGGLGGLSALLITHPRYAILGFFAFLPFQPLLNDVLAGRAPHGIAACKDVFAAAILSTFLLRYMRRRWYMNRTLYLFIGFGVLGAIYVPFAPDWLRALLQIRGIALYPLMALLVANLIETPQELRRLLRVFAVVGAVAVIYGIAQYLTLFDVPYRNVGGNIMQRMGRFDGFGIVSIFADRPSFGGYLIPLFLLFFQVKLWPSTKVWRPLRWLGLAAIGACLVLTYSRTTWIAALIGVLVLFFLRDKVKATLISMALCASMLIAYQVKSVFLSSSMEEAVTSGGSFMVRLNYWPRVLEYVSANPFGIGLGMVGGPHLFESKAQSDVYGKLSYDPNAAFDQTGGLTADNMLMVTDNAYLKFLVQGGFLLLFVFLWLIASILRLAYNTLRDFQTPWGAPQDASDVWMRDVVIWATSSFAALLTILMFVDFVESAPSIAVYWLAVGALCCVRKMHQAQVAARMQSS